MYTIIKEVFLMKALYIHDCRYDFIDDQENLIFSFKSPSNHPITPRDIRKLQLASMLKGEWCKFEEIPDQLSSLHALNSVELGEIIIFFELFNYNSEKLVDNLPIKIEEILSTITTKSISSAKFDLFLIEPVEKNKILSYPIELVHRRWRRLKYLGEIHTVEDLINQTRSSLKKIHGIGDKTIAELEAFLADKGLHLKEE